MRKLKIFGSDEAKFLLNSIAIELKKLKFKYALKSVAIIALKVGKRNLAS